MLKLFEICGTCLSSHGVDVNKRPAMFIYNRSCDLCGHHMMACHVFTWQQLEKIGAEIERCYHDCGHENN